MALEGIRQRLPKLRKERGWSRERLAHVAYAIDPEGASAAQITAIERGDRRASARTILTLAEALEVDPYEFPEYRLAIARHVLDEDKVELDRAVKTLERSGLDSITVSPEEVRAHSKQGRQKAPASRDETAREAKRKGDRVVRRTKP